MVELNEGTSLSCQHILLADCLAVIIIKKSSLHFSCSIPTSTLLKESCSLQHLHYHWAQFMDSNSGKCVGSHYFSAVLNLSFKFKWKTLQRSQNYSHRSLCVVSEVVQSRSVSSNVKTCMKFHIWPSQTSSGEIVLLYMQTLSITHHWKIRVLDLHLFTQKGIPVKSRKKVCTYIWKSIRQGVEGGITGSSGSRWKRWLD